MDLSKKTSKYYGVAKNGNNGKFQVQIDVNRTHKYLGTFNSELEAALFYDEYIKKNHPNKKLNFPEYVHKTDIPNTKIIQLTKGEYAIVDEEDYDRVNQFNWHTKIAKQTKYAARTIHINGKKHSERMHNFILCSDSQMIDHKNGNGLHNYKSNLRLCTSFENACNKRPLKNKSSKYKGVCFNKRAQKYVSSISINNKTIHLGSFDNETDAAIAYDKKAIELQGDFAWLNAKNFHKTILQ